MYSMLPLLFTNLPHKAPSKICSRRQSKIFIIIPGHTIVASIMVSSWSSVCPSVRPSSVRFLFPDDNLSKHNGFSSNLVCALILWISGLGLLMGKFRQIFMELSPETRPYFRLRTLTWVNNKGFSPNLLYALTLRRSGLGLLMGKFRQIFTELSARDTPIFSCPDNNLSK